MVEDIDVRGENPTSDNWLATGYGRRCAVRSLRLVHRLHGVGGRHPPVVVQMAGVIPRGADTIYLPSERRLARRTCEKHISPCRVCRDNYSGGRFCS